MSGVLATSGECAADEICGDERPVRWGKLKCVTGRTLLWKTALQIIKATVAEARKQRGKEDISRYCKGGDSGQGYRFGGLSTNRSLHARGRGPSRNLVQKEQGLRTGFNAWKGGCTWALLLEVLSIFLRLDRLCGFR